MRSPKTSPFVAVASGTLAAVLGLASCKVETGSAPEPAKTSGPAPPVITEVATSSRQWAGLAVAHDGSLFVGFPRWSADVPVSVGRLGPGNAVEPVPDAAWNAWQPGADPANAWVCAQGLWVDRRGSLWVIDPASPSFAGVVEGGAKLVEIDPRSFAVLRTIRFGPDVAPPASYLNDVRVDLATGTAYLTDSGLGAIVVVDLATGAARRLLAGHPSTQSEGLALRFDGQEFRLPDGSLPQVHSDGIALSADGAHLYWHALTGVVLWRIETAALRDATLTAEQLGAKVEKIAVTAACDGMEFGFDGSLYITALQESAIQRLTPDGKLETLVTDPRLQWPDSLAVRSDGLLLVTTSQIHRGFGGNPPDPWRILSIRTP